MDIRIINFAVPQTSGVLVDVIYWLISVSSSIAVGVILFTVILKLITFPFDLYSRISMKKNSILMEEMRPELEKLQKQYANDKVLYNQKMMALYKKNGYSMWGACLPTIVTLVIFIVAISAFSKYSGFQNQKYFYDMSLSYNSAIYEGFADGGDIIYYNAEDKTFVVDKEVLETEVKTLTVGQEKNIENTNVYLSYNGNNLSVYTLNGYAMYEVDCTIDANGLVTFGSERFKTREDILLSSDLTNENGQTYAQIKQENSEFTSADFIRDIARTRSRDTFRVENQKFLWVKNIFMPDSTSAHPIEDNWDEFVVAHGYDTTQGSMNSNDYSELIAKLDNEKTAPNGYFILVLLTALTSFFMQAVTSKSQQAQMELQTVDGQGAQTQKVMKWMMPIMMAIFAFMYTAAFSIYIVLSSLISIVTTVLINFIVQKKYAKVVEAKKSAPIRGRVYVEKEQPKKEQPKTKKKQKNQIDDHDFLSGKADRKPRR